MSPFSHRILITQGGQTSYVNIILKRKKILVLYHHRDHIFLEETGTQKWESMQVYNLSALDTSAKERNGIGSAPRRGLLKIMLDEDLAK